MKLFVGITDKDWFDILSKLQPEEVNFWRPSSTQSFRALSPGEPFLFKLHSPYDYIVGGGFYVRHTALPLSIAWNLFGGKNGTLDVGGFHVRIYKYRKERSLDPIIGCTILNEPFFLEESDWIDVPLDWSKNIVVGKRYDTKEPIGENLWEQIQLKLHSNKVQVPSPNDTIAESGGQYGKLYLTRARLGQGAFKVLVTDAYQRCCAISAEKILPVLEASHIKPFSESGPNQVSNGLLLRSDLHILMDRGYLTITKDYHVEVSKRIKEEFDNGKYYYGMHGNPLAVLPRDVLDRPSPDFIEWHNQNVFI